MVCTNCGNANTAAHYEHIVPPTTFHMWDEVPAAAVPLPQPCPINGCFVANPPQGQQLPVYPALFTLCLDCGNIF